MGLPVENRRAERLKGVERSEGLTSLLASK